jgi:hypothetical protein
MGTIGQDTGALRSEPKKLPEDFRALRWKRF